MTDHWRPYQPGDDPLALRYMTPEQRADVVARARLVPPIEPIRPSGPRRPRKLTDEAVIAIRQARAAGRAVKELAAEHGVSPGLISSIARGRERRWVAGPRLMERIDTRALRRAICNLS